MIDENLAVPFTTCLLDVSVDVVGVDISTEDQIVAICRRGRERLKVDILELPFPSPPPEGWEWIEAYRAWKEPRS